MIAYFWVALFPLACSTSTTKWLFSIKVQLRVYLKLLHSKVENSDKKITAEKGRAERLHRDSLRSLF